MKRHMNLNKPDLIKIWKKLDKACEAIESLEENGVDVHDLHGVDSSAVVGLKNTVESMIEAKSRKTWEGIK